LKKYSAPVLSWETENPALRSPFNLYSAGHSPFFEGDFSQPVAALKNRARQLKPGSSPCGQMFGGGLMGFGRIRESSAPTPSASA
jgi:hypothetical protein